MLFHEREEVREATGAGDDHSLAEQGAAFGAANVEDVAETCEVRERNVVYATPEGVGEARAIHVEREVVPGAGLGDARELV